MTFQHTYQDASRTSGTVLADAYLYQSTTSICYQAACETAACQYLCIRHSLSQSQCPRALLDDAPVTQQPQRRLNGLLSTACCCYELLACAVGVIDQIHPDLMWDRPNLGSCVDDAILLRAAINRASS